MSIDYTKLVRNIVEPRFAYHGFRYEEPLSSEPPAGHFFFVRNYWCKRQYVSIGRVEYREEGLVKLPNEDEDLPTEIPPEWINRDSEDRVWLSNRYLQAVICGASMIRGESLFGRTFDAQTVFQPLDPEIARKNIRALWWEFRNEGDLRQVLNEIVEDFLREGLEYLEQEVADIRRFHEKLDGRRIAEKERRAR